VVIRESLACCAPFPAAVPTVRPFYLPSLFLGGTQSPRNMAGAPPPTTAWLSSGVLSTWFFSATSFPLTAQILCVTRFEDDSHFSFFFTPCAARPSCSEPPPSPFGIVLRVFFPLPFRQFGTTHVRSWCSRRTARRSLSGLSNSFFPLSGAPFLPSPFRNFIDLPISSEPLISLSQTSAEMTF